MPSTIPAPWRTRWPAHQRRWAIAMLVLLLAAGYWQSRRLSLPWRPAMAADLTGAAADRAQLPAYRATIQNLPIAGIADNLSGLTYNPETGTLFGVVNRPPAVVELSTTGVLLRHIPITGAKDTEGIAHVGGDWFAIADERRNRIHWVQIVPGQHVVALQCSTTLALGDVRIKNFGVEGLGWDAARQQLLAVTEKWPLQVLAIDGPQLVPGERVIHPAIQPWEPRDAGGLPTTDLASVEVDPRTGHWLLLGEESSVLYEYTRAGEPLGVMPLWADMNGLDDTISQPEAVAMDRAGTLYIVAEPNLFYRFEKRS